MFCHFQEYFAAIIAQRDNAMELMKERGQKRQKEQPQLPSSAIMVIESVFRLFEDMYKNNGINRDDFRIALIRSSERRRRDGNSGPFMMFTTLTINVWCLNPAVAFAVSFS